HRAAQVHVGRCHRAMNHAPTKTLSCCHCMVVNYPHHRGANVRQPAPGLGITSRYQLTVGSRHTYEPLQARAATRKVTPYQMSRPKLCSRTDHQADRYHLPGRSSYRSTLIDNRQYAGRPSREQIFIDLAKDGFGQAITHVEFAMRVSKILRIVML